MNNRERFLAVMHYEPVDRIPCCAYGYWPETIDRWESEGHLPKGTASAYRGIRTHALPDDSELEREIDEAVGFDFNIHSLYTAVFPLNCGLYPPFEQRILKERPDGSQEYINYEGVVMLRKFHRDGGSVSAIQQHLRHTLTDRESWEKHYKPRLQFHPERFDRKELARLKEESPTRTRPLGLHCGSMLGQLRNWLGFEELCVMPVDEPELFDEMIETIGELHYQNTKFQLESGVQFDYAHFWEDMCGNNGPLVTPKLYYEKIGPIYQRITELLKQYGVDIVSLDSDGKVDELVPTWLDHGINVLFPLEYGPWRGSIAPFREKYGRKVRGLGGMRKLVLAAGREEIDEEIQRLKPLVEMGGYIPSPDHRIPPEASWENVRYYTEKFKETFS